ncbi:MULTISPECIES: class I SAM-dependent methyltransferase [Streptomyces]|uniref:Class I SAM-dependent methyltransferase n=1 Tax=Streptomyces californicus TaxID=67351 RepID=A0ABD7CYE1_9ACTN|nr:MULTISPECIES: class I SAM-dependent methyltransferase [Streptomyces]KOG77975.1 methyltransferase type 11 [Streptomyces griseus subsp. rhodochrous]MDP9950931.1 SAM-dependent methyltransferase [Streptomyces sp. DSM 41269]QRV29107.1 class I SAM-dependent methyltransferase [Streptomyces californicus]QRV35287.1 class I SAM-dependent methyltransferase [Streptomyces californicus]QRV42521.1 class I SAM-dependent methyltransferase [Streptomyces californicus]
MTDARSAAWDTYSRGKPQRRRTNAKGETTWFNWSQYPDHGPGAEVLALRPGDSVLDLGCGSGGNTAHLATLGMTSVGVDLSAKQLDKARERWSGVGGMELHQSDALAYLGSSSRAFDAMYSVFGAAWFTDPALLLPAVHAHLKPSGVFTFSQRPPVEGCYGCQASYIPRGPDEDPAVVKRWDYEPGAWELILKEHGYVDVSASVIPPPSGSRRTGTLLVRAVRGSRAARSGQQ